MEYIIAIIGLVSAFGLFLFGLSGIAAGWIGIKRDKDWTYLVTIVFNSFFSFMMLYFAIEMFRRLMK